MSEALDQWQAFYAWWCEWILNEENAGYTFEDAASAAWDAALESVAPQLDEAAHDRDAYQHVLARAHTAECAVGAAVLAEREACARIAEGIEGRAPGFARPVDIARYIRARNKEGSSDAPL